MSVKTLTIKQPWADLIMLGLKDVENRSWPTKHRGRLGIHVSRKAASDHDLESAPDGAIAKATTLRDLNSDAGHVIGYVELIDCLQTSTSPWALERSWHWMLSAPVRLHHPVPAKGRLGLWNFDGL